MFTYELVRDGKVLDVTGEFSRNGAFCVFHARGFNPRWEEIEQRQDLTSTQRMCARRVTGGER